jgi:ferredoxin
VPRWAFRRNARRRCSFDEQRADVQSALHNRVAQVEQSGCAILRALRKSQIETVHGCGLVLLCSGVGTW